MFPDGENLDRLILAGKHVLTVSQGGAVLRAWKVTDGALAWEAASARVGAVVTGLAPSWRFPLNKTLRLVSVVVCLCRYPRV